MGLFAGGVDHVERHARLIGDHDGAVDRLALDLGRARIGVAFRPVIAFGQQLLLQEGDDVAVLGMDQRHGAELGAAGEGREHLVVIHHQRALVGHEVLEGVDAGLDHLGHLVEIFLAPPGHAHVEGIVGAGRAGLLEPGLQRVQRALVGGRQAEIDGHGGAAGQRRGRAGIEIVGRMGAHEGHFHMGVRVDAAGHDVGAGGVDHLVARQVRTDRRDGVAVDQDVGLVGEIGGNDRAALDDDGHGLSPPAAMIDAALPRPRTFTAANSMRVMSAGPS